MTVAGIRMAGLLPHFLSTCRVIIISQGRVVADETPAQLRARKPGARIDEIFRDLTHGDI